MKKDYSRFIPLIFIFIFGLSIFYISYEKDCGYDSVCFQESFKLCDKSSYKLNEQGVLFEYRILGRSQDSCKVEVSVIDIIDSADPESDELFIGKEMICNIPENQIFTIDTLSLCTGPLKEAMYELIIQKVYSILAQNLGELIYELK